MCRDAKDEGDKEKVENMDCSGVGELYHVAVLRKSRKTKRTTHSINSSFVWREW